MAMTMQQFSPPTPQGARPPTEARGTFPDGRLAALRGRAPAATPRWALSTVAGRLVELSGAGAAANLTLAFSLVLEAQERGEPVAWLMTTASTFYPPDVAASGVDLDALVVVRLPDPRELPRAAGELAASGAFGLVVLDLDPGARIPSALQVRLAGLAREHGTAVLCLTRAATLGAPASLRGEAIRQREVGETEAAPGGAFACVVRALEDRRLGPGWEHMEVCRGPNGL